MSDLHAKIMNLECNEPDLNRTSVAPAYRLGHRDARHAAAELAAMEAARIEALEAALANADGCANWCDALLEIVRGTSCEPDDPEAFEEVLLGAQTFLAIYRQAREATK